MLPIAQSRRAIILRQLGVLYIRVGCSAHRLDCCCVRQSARDRGQHASEGQDCHHRRAGRSPGEGNGGAGRRRQNFASPALCSTTERPAASVTGCLLNSAARWEPAKSHANGTEPWSAQQRSERRRRGIDLIVMGTGRKGAQLFDEGLVPGTFQKFDKTMFALRGKRIGTELL